MDLREKLIQYIDFCKYRKELDQKTLKAYLIDLKQYFYFVNCGDPGKEVIENYITELHKKYKQKTIKRKIASIKAFYNYLEEEEIIEQNPFGKIKVKFKEILTLPRIIPREEIEQLLNCMYEYLEGKNTLAYKFRLRDVAVVEIFFATGARVYEISNIKEDSINLNTGLIKIMGKEGKERYLQICNPSILAILKNIIMKMKVKLKKVVFSL